MPTGSGGRAGERGYTLAVLVGLLAVLGILLGAALPHWASRVQRAKEAELVARGLQYAEAIRVFQRRFGRLPNTLAELVEIEPRSIRKLWRNPFAKGDDPGWAVLVEAPGGEIVPLDPATGELLAVGESERETSEEDADGEEPASGIDRGGGLRSLAVLGGSGVAGPIHGVRSKLRGEAYRVYFDRKDFGDWEFTVERLVAATGALTPDGLPRRADYATIGRAFPYPPPGGTAGTAPEVPAAGSAPSGSEPSAGPPETDRPPPRRPGQVDRRREIG
jgi:type II secretory pathway pseudopilin PulG